MALGYSVKGVCFASSQEAIDAYYSDIPPLFIQNALNNTKVIYVNSGGTWQLQKQTVSLTGAVTTDFSSDVSTAVYGSCTVPNTPSESFADGMSLGWGVAAACVLAWAVWVLKKGL